MTKGVKKEGSSGKNMRGFPRIPRIIPEKGHNSRFFYIGLYTFVLLSLIFVGIELAENLVQYNKNKLERAKVEAELAFWQEASVKFPGYRDAYFKMAVLNYQLGNSNEAKTNLQKTLEIDPNFQKGRELEKLLVQ